jgi:hypothetical protein
MKLYLHVASENYILSSVYHKWKRSIKAFNESRVCVSVADNQNFSVLPFVFTDEAT